MRMGFTMRQQAVAACYAKVLRLNSSSIADISAGKVLACLMTSKHAYCWKIGQGPSRNRVPIARAQQEHRAVACACKLPACHGARMSSHPS